MNCRMMCFYLKENPKPVTFIGKEVAFLNTNHWEYYTVQDSNTVWHFRKDKVVLFIDRVYQDIPHGYTGKTYTIFVHGLFPNGFKLKGVYRRDLETEWHHFYQRKNGVLLRFLKSEMMAVHGDTIESIIKNRGQQENG